VTVAQDLGKARDQGASVSIQRGNCQTSCTDDQVITKGRSANKFRKLQIRKFANLNNVFDLRPSANAALCGLKTQSFFISGLKTSTSPQILYILFLLENITWNFLIQSTKLKIFFKICGFTICGLVVKVCGLAICGLAHLRNFSDLRFADF
jgi:hypothetical protein